MDAERAETFLRTLAEARLRRALTGPALRPHDMTAGVDKAADALTEVGAIDARLAQAIVAEFRQAFEVRSSGSGSRHHVRPGPGVAGQMPLPLFHDFQGRPSPAGSSEGMTAEESPIRVTPVGRAIPFSDDEHDGMYLTALVVTPDSASLMAGTWTHDPGGGVRDHRLIHGLTATDDQGAACHLAFNGGGSLQSVGGPYELHPTPPQGIQWLDVSGGDGQRAIRINLAVPPAFAQARTEADPASPAGLLLHRVANRLLAYWEPDRRIVDSQVAGLGDTVAALEAARALPAGSPMPGQLAALCEQLGVTGHGIVAAPESDLPQTWGSLLAHHLGGNPGSGSGARAASAAFAAALPELDGVHYAVAGLHTSYDQTWLHAFAYGQDPQRGQLPAPSSWWLKDTANQWHVAVVSAWNESYLQMLVVPAINPVTTALELVIEGQTGRVRAELPVTWWSPS
jgi:hypothetical protein